MILQIVKTVLALLFIGSLAYLILRIFAKSSQSKTSGSSAEFEVLEKLYLDRDNQLISIYLPKHEKKLFLSSNKNSGIRLLSEEVYQIDAGNLKKVSNKN